MKSKLFLLVPCYSFGLLLLGCSGGKRMTQTEPQKESASPCPAWFTELPQNPNYLYAAATATSKDLQLAINKAKLEGRTEIGEQLETRLKSLTRKFQEEIGEGESSVTAAQFTRVSETVVSVTLTGGKIKNQTTKLEGTLWRACVLIEYPLGEANAQYLESLKQNESLRPKVEGTEPWKELEAAVEKYEQQKKASNQQQ